jgi:hypothetical protein
LSRIVCKARRRFTRFSSAEWFIAITASSTTTLITNVICTAGCKSKNFCQRSTAYSFGLRLQLQDNVEKYSLYVLYCAKEKNISLKE